MEWQEISSAETAAAGNAPEMVDDTIMNPYMRN